MTSYTNSGMNALPYCSSSLSFKRILSCFTDVAESMTENSRINMILDPIHVSREARRLILEVGGLHRIHQWRFAFKVMNDSFTDSIEEIVKRRAEKQDLQNLLV